MMFFPQHAWSIELGMTHYEFDRLLDETELFIGPIEDPEYNLLMYPVRSNNSLGFKIKGTHFWLMTDINIIRPCFWWARETENFSWPQTQSCSFEEMFEDLPENIKEKFIFHLDLFVQ